MKSLEVLHEERIVSYVSIVLEYVISPSAILS